MLVPDLNPDIVSSYLNDNPLFLDKYVLSNVNQDQVERWLAQKSHQQKTTRRLDSTGTHPTVFFFFFFFFGGGGS